LNATTKKGHFRAVGPSRANKVTHLLTVARTKKESFHRRKGDLKATHETRGTLLWPSTKAFRSSRTGVKYQLHNPWGGLRGGGTKHEWKTVGPNPCDLRYASFGGTGAEEKGKWGKLPASVTCWKNKKKRRGKERDNSREGMFRGLAIKVKKSTGLNGIR